MYNKKQLISCYHWSLANKLFIKYFSLQLLVITVLGIVTWLKRNKGVVSYLHQRSRNIPNRLAGSLIVLATFRLQYEDDCEYEFSVLSTRFRFGGRKFSKCACSELKTRSRSRPRTRTPIWRSNLGDKHPPRETQRTDATREHRVSSCLARCMYLFAENSDYSPSPWSVFWCRSFLADGFLPGDVHPVVHRVDYPGRRCLHFLGCLVFHPRSYWN